MRTLTLILISSFSTICTTSFAQMKSGKISGVIQDENLKSIEAATSTLLKILDSSVVKITASDKSGKFEFENISQGKYLVSVSAVGHKTAFSEAIEINETNSTVNLEPINILSTTKSL